MGLLQRLKLTSTYNEPPSCVDIKKALPCNDTSLHNYNSWFMHSVGPAIVTTSGSILRIFSWSLWFQAAVMIGFTFLLGHNLCDHWVSNVKMVCYPQAYVGGVITPTGVSAAQSCIKLAQDNCWGYYSYGESVAKTLVGFVVGGFISQAMAQTYYKGRGQSGNSYSQTIALASMLASYVHPTNPDDPEEAAEVDATRRVLVRWMNAAFRMMYLKHRGEDASILITEGYLTDDEWEELKDVTKPAMHLYQWVGDVLYQCTSKGFIQHPIILGQMQEALETLRSADGWGVPTLPYAYVLLVTLLVKLYLFMYCFYGGQYVWYNLLLKDVPGWNDFQSDTDFFWQDVWLCFVIVMINLFYQGALDFHSMIRKPNQNLLDGHCDVPGLFNTAEKVSNELITNARRRSIRQPLTQSRKLDIEAPKQTRQSSQNSSAMGTFPVV